MKKESCDEMTGFIFTQQEWKFIDWSLRSENFSQKYYPKISNYLMNNEPQFSKGISEFPGNSLRMKKTSNHLHFVIIRISIGIWNFWY